MGRPPIWNVDGGLIGWRAATGHSPTQRIRAVIASGTILTFPAPRSRHSSVDLPGEGSRRAGGSRAPAGRPGGLTGVRWRRWGGCGDTLLVASGVAAREVVGRAPRGIAQDLPRRIDSGHPSGRVEAGCDVGMIFLGKPS